MLVNTTLQTRTQLPVNSDLTRSSFEWAWRVLNEYPMRLVVHSESRRYAESLLFDWGWCGLHVESEPTFAEDEWELFGRTRSVHSGGA